MHPAEILWVAAIGFVVVGSIGYFLSLYNGLVELKNNIARSWANVDVLLKQRHDEIPKLVSTCEAYMQHERAVFDKMAEARASLQSARTVGQRAEAENMIGRALGGILAVAENYPDLKASAAFRDLMAQLEGTENRITVARGRYIAAVADYNTTVQTFPTMCGAKLRGRGVRPTFTATTPNAEVAPKVQFP